MLADPHFNARKSIVMVPDRKGKPLPMQNVFPRLTKTPGTIRHAGPQLGEHTNEVLKGWLDMNDAQLDTLRNSSII